ncbi:MAG TPA: tetraacyldisaccharide 4'-kinase [Pirellulales bacterium]
MALAHPAGFREIVSGRARGIWPTLARGCLRLLEIPYTAAVGLRNWRYDTGRAAIHRASVPVVSVGNLTLGGTGKTPMVEWLARWYAAQHMRVAIVSRGYGSQAGHANDESLELAQKLPGVPHVLDADRVRGAKCAVDEYAAQLVILDDGFQHRRLHRDLNISLVDALEPDGFGHVFPRGTLREPLSGWRRAESIVLTRADMVDELTRGQIRAHVMRHAPSAVWIEACYRPKSLLDRAGHEHPLGELQATGVAAFCGIGNPDGFWRSLEDCGFRLLDRRAFPDHFAYSPADADKLASWATQAGATALLCTCKDLVKIGPLWTFELPLYALVSRLELLTGAQPFEALLRRCIATQPRA